MRHVKGIAVILAALNLASCAARDQAHERALRELKPVTDQNAHSIFEELFRALDEIEKHDKAFAKTHRRALERLEIIDSSP